jgi:hypothetical protein
VTTQQHQAAAPLAAAVNVARRLGLRVEEPVVLSEHHNLIVWLRPSPVVARVATRTAQVRGPIRLAESLDLARWLVDAGLPVSPPADGIDPGPHVTDDGWRMTLWRHLDVIEANPDPGEVGRSLRSLHLAMAEYPRHLVSADPLTEARLICDLAADRRPGEVALLRQAADTLDLPHLDPQPIHGDAHLGNVLVTSAGQRWIDWEESWHGPVAWDLACLEHRRRVFGELGDEIAVALLAYGPYDVDGVDAYAPLVAIWAGAWGVMKSLDDERLGERTGRRLAWIRAWASR